MIPSSTPLPRERVWEVSASPFVQQVNDSSADDFQLPPPGLHPACVVGFVDLGTHENSYNGEKKPDKRINFVIWELVGTKDNDGKPFIVGCDFTDSLGKKANWRAFLVAWRGRDFAQNEVFDPLVLLGVKCNVNISAGLTTEGKKFVTVETASPPMAGQTIPDPVREQFWFHLSVWGDPTIEPPIPGWAPRNYGKTLASEIKKSREWVDLKAKHNLIPASNPAPAANGTSQPGNGTPAAQTQPLDRNYNPATAPLQSAGF